MNGRDSNETAERLARTPQWKPIRDEAEAARLIAQLRRELPPGHVLEGIAVVALARRTDTDDVLFQADLAGRPLATVHLTWRNAGENTKEYPWTTFYADWDAWARDSE